MIGKGATPSFFAIANYNYTLTNSNFSIGSKIDYSRSKKRRGKSKYLLSVCVMVENENAIAYPMMH